MKDKREDAEIVAACRAISEARKTYDQTISAAKEALDEAEQRFGEFKEKYGFKYL